MSTTVEKYNGWTNWETWSIITWFDPETKEDVEVIRAQVEEDIEKMPEYLRQFVDYDRINWDEILESVDPEED